MKIYIAARFDRLPEMNVHAEELRQKGHNVDCRWLNGSHQLHAGAEQLDGQAGFTGNSKGITMMALPFALDDVEDLSAADAIILFSESPESHSKRGGRHVEFGMALALRKILIIVGPRENVFHCLPEVAQFDTWQECLGTL